MGKLFSKPDFPEPKTVEEPEPLPTEVDEDVVDSRKRERRRAASSKGRSSTVLTSPLGLTDSALTTGSVLTGS